ncbi:MAG: MFS transporter [Candidatus Paceibacterota bacterium]|jgi:MFS family permease
MNSKKLRIYTYVGAVFMAAYSSIPAYVNSSFLTKFLSEQGIGWLYAITSFITIILMLVMPRLIRRFGNKNILIWSVGLGIISIIPLAFPTPKVIHTLTAFGFYLVFMYLIRYALDVYLENISEDKGTGFIRGVYATAYNFAWLVSPLLAAYLVSQGSFNLVFGIAGLALIPLLLITFFKLSEHQEIKTDNSTVRQELKYLWTDKTQTAANIRDVLVIDFLLNFFYAVMVVYMPIYLHNHIGLSWTEIGLAFTVMLLPFVLFELPLGKIADKWFGEKEIMIGGIIIIAITTSATVWLNLPNWILWAIILFLTRTGAATIEIMKETYLFKKIDGVDTGIISLSRINVPFSYLVGPVFVSLVLMILDFKYIFLLLGLIMLINLKYAWGLKDTK